MTFLHVAMSLQHLLRIVAKCGSHPSAAEL
jgi:hypothetical protein